jgi:hypothetical protein
MTEGIRQDTTHHTRGAEDLIAGLRSRAIASSTPEFQRLVTITNRVAAEFNGARDTCILTSFALHDALRRLGYNSRPLRVEAAVFPDDQKPCGTILGSLNGCRRAAKPDMWWGHLAVLVDDEWLLDPTLDQANKEAWPRSMRVGPLAIRLSDKFWAERGSTMVRTNGCEVRFSPHPRQLGFANAGDARPSHWRPLADRIFRGLNDAGVTT